MGTNLANGVVGAVIIREKPALPEEFIGKPTPKPVPEEHVMLIQVSGSTSDTENIEKIHFFYSNVRE